MKEGRKMKYYKATDKNMRCRGYQFELGKWSEPVDGELKECENGYHFCTDMVGVYVYYPEDCRVFEIEIDEDNIISDIPGTDAKSITRRVKLVKEVTPDVDGNYNSGDYNSGDCNSGDYNSGDCNSGNYNSGNCNSGDRNSGDCNSGDRNSGDCNSGDRNSGDRNSGDCNSGNYNSGDCNSGDRNSGDCNSTSNSSGSFNTKKQTVNTFDKDSGMTLDELKNISCYYDLIQLLSKDREFDYTLWGEIPNATPEAVERLHRALIEGRKNGNIKR